MKARWWRVGAGVLLAVLIAAAAYHLLSPRRTPAGQPPLAVLTAENLHQLRAQFNAASGGPRILALLSPT